MSKYLPVTKDYANNWMYFKESDIRKACRLDGCDRKEIEDCIANMRRKSMDCVGCFMRLVTDLGLLPIYEEEIEKEGE